ncbi:MAG: glycoside hydrolase TIM-barrel-like domain-containing protein, partial [Pseudomonadota bacterium]
MAQLIISAASTVAGAVGQAGVGAAIARTAAATAASFAAGAVERAIFGPRKRTVEGPRLESFTVQASTEGAGVLRVYGRARVSGQIIWAANFKETRNETTETQGGKGGPAARTTTIDYRYSISFAVGLCEGVIDRIGRVWADGKPLDLSRFNFRLYHGTEDQTPDPTIDAIEGRAPAFRGLAYIVFEDMPLADFGNRIPQLSFEVEKRLARDDDAALENAVTAVTMIPGSGEFVYGTTPVLRQEGEGVTAPENVHNNAGVADFAESFESLRASLPNVRAVSLINAWFGDDLRAGQCTIRPGVDAPIKETTPYVWTAGGATRESAHLVSTVNGAPAYGGTPADRAVIEAIRTMTDAGVAVMMHPFILMDIPLGNALPDPYGGGEQAAHPWRGRITAGANDGSPAAAGDIAAFFGTARPADFSIVGDTVSYAGPEEWSFRRFILHQAYLAKAATQGGAPIEAFIIGSELRGVTTARSGPGAYPAVAAMIALAHDVRAVLGPSVKISYGADWSEYFGHQPPDGSGDVYFHLDPFWADPVVDFIGVDNYMPLADWRDGFTHRDAEAGFTGPHERAYLQSNIEGGEGYDWFYLSADHRDAQTRSPISDGAYGEDWIFRYKDLRGWWENPHHNRPGGVRDSAPTA